MSTLRVAVVGVGHLGRIHARILAKLEGCSLVGVVDPLAENRERATAECGAPAFASCEELPGEIDAAVVATPTRFHRDVSLRLLDRGVHLLVEKPLAGTWDEANDLVAASRRRQAVLQVGHIERFNPAFVAARPHLFEPKYIEAVRRGPFSFRSTDIGVVLDLMIHDIDLVLALACSRVSRVQALGVAMLGKHEDVANARLTFENGCVATLSASRAARTPARTMQVWCPRVFAQLDFNARTAELVRPSEALLSRQVDVDSLAPAERMSLKDRLYDDHLPLVPLVTETYDAITAELADFRDSIRAGRAPRVTGEAGRDAIEVAERIIDQIERHAWTGDAEGPSGPLALPKPKIIRGPHWGRKPAAAPEERREAG